MKNIFKTNMHLSRITVFIILLIIAGSFATAAPEILDNGIDEDGDGYINTQYYDIKRDHPRMLLDDATLTRLRGYACYDNSGNKISGCTPTERWTDLINSILTDNINDYGREAWMYALLYKITQSTEYRTAALTKLNSDLDSFFSDLRFDSYLHDGDTIKNIALTVDWMYNDIDQATKNRAIGYITQGSYEISHSVYGGTCPCVLNNNCPSVTDVSYNCNHAGWGLDQSLDNYHYSHMLAYAASFISIVGEENGGSYFMEPMKEYYEHMHGSNGDIENQELYGNGGGWMEGINYNYPAKMRITNGYALLATATKTNYFSQLNFMHDNPYYQFFVVQPGFTHVVPYGDLARTSEMPLFDYDWFVVGMAARYLPDGEAKRMAQYWRSHTLIPYYGDWVLTASRYMTPDNFLLYVENAPETDYQSKLSYYAKGSGFVNTRSGWEDNDVSISFTSTCYFQGHQNPDQNTFLIWREGWQIVDDNTYSSTGIIQNTLGENTMYINNQGQNSRTSDMRLNGQPANQALCGHITNFEEAGTFTFMQGDAAGTYSTLNTYDRQIIYIRPEKIVMHDRVEAKSPSYSKQSLMHFNSAPTVSGNLISHTNAGGKVFIRNHLPSGASISIANDLNDVGSSTYRAVISAPTGNAYTTFLNVFEIPASTKSSMIESELVSGTNMEGAVVDNTYIVMFSKTTSTISSDSFAVAGSGTRTLILTDLTPNAKYTISVSNNVISVSSGGSMTASSQGVLYAQISLSGAVTPSCTANSQITSTCLCGSTAYSTGYCCNNTWSSAACSVVIPSLAVCGNNNIETGEACDDGNSVTESCAYGVRSCTVCSATCTNVAGATAYCSDGRISNSEACDDGNSVSGDGCSSSCTIETPAPINNSTNSTTNTTSSCTAPSGKCYFVGSTRSYKTLSALISGGVRLNGGDYVLIDPETINEPGQVNLHEIRSSSDTNPNSYAVIKGNGGRPKLVFTAPTGGYGAGISLRGVNRMRIENIEMQGYNDGQSNTANIKYGIRHEATNTILSNIVVHDFMNCVLGTDYNSGSLTISDSEFYNCGNSNSGAIAHGLYIATDTPENPDAVFRLERSYLHNPRGGNAIKTRSARNEIYYNWIEHSINTGRNLEMIGKDHEDNFDVYHEPGDVVGNVFIKEDSGSLGFVRLGTDWGDTTTESNGDYRFVNNDFIALSARNSLVASMGDVRRIEFYNNIFSVPGSSVSIVALDTSSPTIIGTNNWFSSGISKGTLSGVSGSGSDPGFTSLSSRNFELTQSSAAVNAGVMNPATQVANALWPPAYEPSKTSASTRTMVSTIDIGSFESSYGSNNSNQCTCSGTSCNPSVVGQRCNGCNYVSAGTETCNNNLDDDCDGSIDEGCTVVCTAGQTKNCNTGSNGICSAGTQTCSNNAWSNCIMNNAPVQEICDNSLDDNCDGSIDEDCGPKCDCANTLCSVSNNGMKCDGCFYVTAPKETCNNNADDDCDGLTDSKDTVDCQVIICTAGQTQNCNTGKSGICSEGAQTCTNNTWGTCTQKTAAGTETCGNSIDEDCNGYDLACSICGDGLIDTTKGEECDSNNLKGKTCTDYGTEYTGTLTCSKDCRYDPSGCIKQVPTECTAGQTHSCTTGMSGVCSEGIGICTTEGKWGVCTQNTQATTEICNNNLDDDCDGLTDSAEKDCQPGTGTSCKPGMAKNCNTGKLGECSKGKQTCTSSGAWNTCKQIYTQKKEACNNNLDDDCDGQTDENCGSISITTQKCCIGKYCSTWLCKFIK